MEKSIYCKEKQFFEIRAEDTQFIDEKNVYFHSQKIPFGLNFFEDFMFCKSVVQSFDGFILSRYKIKGYLIIAYTKKPPKTRNFCVLIFEKIHLLREILKIDAQSEIWIIKDSSYICVGIIKNRPVFLKKFDNICDLNQNFPLILENMLSYSKNPVYRFFGISVSDFNFNLGERDSYEYSESFVGDALNGEKSIDNFCRKNFQHKRRSKILTLIKLGLNLILNCFSIYLLWMNSKLVVNTKIIQSKMLNLPEFPSKPHYDAIKNAQNVG